MWKIQQEGQQDPELYQAALSQLQSLSSKDGMS